MTTLPADLLFAKRAAQSSHLSAECRGVLEAGLACPLTAWSNKEGNGRAARLTETGWQVLSGTAKPSRSHQVGADFVASPDEGGPVWLLSGSSGVMVHDGEAWQPDLRWARGAHRFDVGAGDTLWARIGTSDFAHRAAGDVNVYDASHGIVPLADPFQALASGLFEVAPDGSIWYGPVMDPGDDSVCGGIARHDGETGTQYLRGRCISAMDIDPDGNVWLQASSLEPDAVVHTYVITPEAVAATEQLPVPYERGHPDAIRIDAQRAR